MALLPNALRYARSGMSIIAVGRDKTPSHAMPRNAEGKITWKEFMTRRATPEELTLWCASAKTTGIALVCGDVSGGLRCIDFDEKEVFSQWCKNIAAVTKKDIRDVLKNVLINRTSRGYQVIHRQFRPRNNQIFAYQPNPEDPKHPVALIETRENGGYCLVPDSLHPSGWEYRWLTGFDNVEDIRIVMPDEEYLWEEEARKLSRMEVKHVQAQHKPQTLSKARVVIEEFNKRHHVTEYLDLCGYTETRPGAYRRPDGHKQNVYIYDHDGVEVTRHFNVIDEIDGVSMFGFPHDPFDWFKICSMGNDLHAALKAAAQEVNIEWTTYELETRVEEPIVFHEGDGDTVILTDSQEVAEMMQENAIPVLVGPTRAWERKYIEYIEAFVNKIVVWAGDYDSANRTAFELDAQVVEFNGGVIGFIREHTIEEFGLVLLNAHDPSF